MTIYTTQTPQPTDPKGKYPRKHVLVATAVGVVLGFALSLSPSSDASAPGRTIVPLANPVSADGSASLESEALNVDNVTPESRNSSPAPVADDNSHDVTIRKGDTLAQIFQKAGLSNQDLESIMAHGKEVGVLKRLQPGQRVHVDTDDKGAVQKLHFEMNNVESLVVARDRGSKFTVKTEKKALTTYTTYAQGAIRSSLIQAGADAKLSPVMTMKLAEIFGWDIDFALALRKGDSFKLIYEEVFADGKKVRDGDILAAEFINQGKRYTAVRFERKDGSHQYLAADGMAMRKAFIRSPVDFARISSPFSLGRYHPILHTMRAHKGTDYAAGYGTPVKATGDGTVALAGRQDGFGNVVKVNHGRGYETFYAHLQAFASGVRNGSHVTQGQVIGYVGSTGLATGPHLHFEFHVNGQVRDPVTVALPNALPIDGPDKGAFAALSKQRMKQLATFAAAFGQEKVALSDGQ